MGISLRLAAGYADALFLLGATRMRSAVAQSRDQIISVGKSPSEFVKQVNLSNARGRQSRQHGFERKPDRQKLAIAAFRPVHGDADRKSGLGHAGGHGQSGQAD